jgi:hypothetical protein
LAGEVPKLSQKVLFVEGDDELFVAVLVVPERDEPVPSLIEQLPAHPKQIIVEKLSLMTPAIG